MKKKPVVNAGMFLQDIRSGFDRDRLMKKYHLSQDQLDRALGKAVKGRLLREEEVAKIPARGHTGISTEQLTQDIKDLLRKHKMGLTGLFFTLNELRDAAQGKAGAMPDGKKKPDQHKINAREFAEDVQLGMDYENLTTKYGLTEDQVAKVIDRLIRTGLLTEVQVYDRSAGTDTQMVTAITRAQQAIDEID